MTAIDAIEELRNEVPHKLSQDRVETLEGFRPQRPGDGGPENPEALEDRRQRDADVVPAACRREVESERVAELLQHPYQKRLSRPRLPRKDPEGEATCVIPR